MAEGDYQNPFLAMLDGGLRMMGAYGYSMFMPLPDAPFLHGAAENRIFNESKYIAYQTQFRDAEINRRIRTLKDNAARFGIDPTIIESNQWAIQMLLKADTPQVREQIRNSMLPGVGDALLRIFDAATGSETGMDRVYAGLANTYGSATGNEMAAYTANYMSNMIRQQPLNKNGLRAVDASSVGNWLQIKQRSGYNFEVAAGLNRDDVQSINQIFSRTWAGGHQGAARKAATLSYVKDLIDNTRSDTDKAILGKIQETVNNGGNIEDIDLSEFYGEGKDYSSKDAILDRFNIKENVVNYAQTNQAAIYSNTIQRALDASDDNKIKQLFSQYAKVNNINLDKIEGDDKAEKRRQRQVRALTNKFIDAVTTDSLKAPGENRVFDTSGTELEKLDALYQKVDEAIGEQGNRAKSEANRLAEEAHITQALGQAAWSQLSAEEQAQYKQAGGGKESGGQTVLGATLMDKYAHEFMRYQDYSRAAGETHRLLSASALAGLSKDDLSKQYAFIGSIMQNKGLTSVAANAAIAWQASAKAQGIMLSDEQRLEANQRIARITDSIEGNNVAMFMNQNFDPDSPLGKLQQALKSGTMTPEQEQQFQEYLKNQGKFVSDIAAATGKDRGPLGEEARWSQANWEGMTGFQRDNVLSYMNKDIMAVRNKQLASEGAIGRAFGKMNTRDQQQMGIGQDGMNEKSFQKMIYDVVQKEGMNVVDLVSGKATEEDISRLRDLGLTSAADYAQKRADERATLVEKYKAQGMSIEEAAEQADQDLGANRALVGMSSIFHDVNAAKNQGKMDRVDATKKTQKEGDKTMSVNERKAAMSREDSVEGGVEKAEKDKTPEEMTLNAMGKSGEGAEQFNNTWIKPIIDILQSLLEAVGGKSKAKKEGSAGDAEDASESGDQVAKALVKAMDSKEFREGFGKGMGAAFAETGIMA